MVYSRISARLGETVLLDVDFYHAGILADPYAIRKIELYHTSVVPHNLAATILVADPDGNNYPLPVDRVTTTEPAGYCGTGPVEGVPIPGKYQLLFNVPTNFSAPDVYMDVWYFYSQEPCILGTDPCDLDDPGIMQQLQKSCHRFWVYPDEWLASDSLQTVNFAIEPLSQRFHQPEVRPLECGLMPTPLYDYNYNLVAPMMPFLQASITISTQYNEILVQDAAMTIGIRHGSYRSNPYVLRYNLDTTQFLKNTYRYRILIQLPDGSTRASKFFIFTVD